MTPIQELRSLTLLAQKESPEPWVLDQEEDGGAFDIYHTFNERRVWMGEICFSFAAAYIAAFTPSVAIGLLDRIDVLEAALRSDSRRLPDG
mgnify:CR=1 FL=1